MTLELIRPATPPTEKEIAKIEFDFGFSFPSEYRRFLLIHNGGRPVPCIFDIEWRVNHELADSWKNSEVSRFLSIHSDEKANFVKYNKVNFPGRIPAETIAIAYDPGGNLILLGIAGEYTGKVLFWVKDFEVEEGEVPGYDNVGFLADSFDEFLNNKLR